MLSIDRNELIKTKGKISIDSELFKYKEFSDENKILEILLDFLIKNIERSNNV